MADVSAPILALNRGVITKQALMRTDLTAKVPWAAEVQNNFMPRMLGPMTLRPGLGYTGATLSNAKSYSLPFIYANDDCARIEITDSNVRIWDNNDALVSRVSVASATANGSFTSNITSWTGASDAGATAVWSDGTAYGQPSGGYLTLTGTGYNRGAVTQTVTVASGDQNKEHALRIVVARGPLILRVGTTSALDDYVAEVILKAGTHSMAFTPTGNFVIQLLAVTNYAVLVDSVNVESSGAMVLPAPWTLSNLSFIRFTNSGQFTYIGNDGIQQREIIRRDNAPNSSRSWSVQLYLPEDGPFRIANTTTISLTPTAVFGDITLAASKPFFNVKHVGALFRITSIGQFTSNILAGDNQFSDPIKVTGIGDQRIFTWAVSNQLSGTLTIQRSVGQIGAWSDVQTNIINLTGSYLDTNGGVDIKYALRTRLYTSGATTATITSANTGPETSNFTAGGQIGTPVEILSTNIGTGRNITYSVAPGLNGTFDLVASTDNFASVTHIEDISSGSSGTFNDGLDNQTIYYRMGFEAGNYVTGATTLTLTNSNNTLTGVARITSFTSNVSVGAVVIDNLGGTAASTAWEEGEWSDYRGWPSAPVIDEGRQWWFGNGLIDGSIPDAYESYDPSIEGDSGVIQQAIGFGPVAKINWALSLARLIIGGDGAEYSIGSSNLDEVVTVSNFKIKAPTSQGSAPVQAVQFDDFGVFVHKNTQRVYICQVDPIYGRLKTAELTKYCPDLCSTSIVRLGVQRTPDTRIHCVFSDGRAAVIVFNDDEDVKAPVTVDTLGASGVIEDVVVLPGTVEDRVYYTVKRTINGSTVRYHERWAQEGQCTGFPEARLADSYILYSGAAVTTISGLGTLEGQTVVVWGWNTVTPFTANLKGVVFTVGNDMGTYTVTGGQITGLPAAVTNACIGLGSTAQYKSTKLAYGGQTGTAITKMKRVESISPVLYNTHFQGIQYGRDFGHLMNLNATINNTVAAPNTIYDTYDDTAIPFGGELDTDSRLCLQAAYPRPCTVLGVIVNMKTNG